MENPAVSPGKFGLSYGVLSGLIVVVISVIMYVTGMMIEGAQWPMWIYYLLFGAIIFYSISTYKKNNGSRLKISAALKIGLVIGIIAGLITALYTLVFNNFIDPEFMNQMMELNREKLLENPNVTEEMIKQSEEVMGVFRNPFILTAITIATSAFFGFLYALIAGLIMKTRESEFH